MSPAAYYNPTPVLRAERGGLAPTATPPLPVTKAARDLHIDARILAQPGLSLTACALLAEVLDLYQVKAQVFANDAHFAARCRCSERTVRSTIAELKEAGYLETEVNHKRADKRLLVPTEKWQNLPEVPAEFAGSTPQVPAEFAGTSGENCRDFRQNLPRVPAEFADINTNLNTKGNTTLNNDAAGAAALGSEKKIGEDFSPSDLSAESLDSTPPVAAAPPAKLHLMRLSVVASYPAFAEAWQAAVAANPDAYADFAGVNLLHYHTALLDWSNANGKKKIDWLATIRASMRSDESKGLLRRLGTVPGAPAAPSQVSQRQATSNALRARYQPS
jgi:hypothetical protein